MLFCSKHYTGFSTIIKQKLNIYQGQNESDGGVGDLVFYISKHKSLINKGSDFENNCALVLLM